MKIQLKNLSVENPVKSLGNIDENLEAYKQAVR